jgi:alkanesulfonate monooxygenase SsuD/methylene tetrahydromethanopterin reductase-like flavin-dependent oxidoreductase (luciferase family)
MTAGFEIVWAAEHHALEMTIAPNPFALLTWWGEHTKNIRLGCGCGKRRLLASQFASPVKPR